MLLLLPLAAFPSHSHPCCSPFFINLFFNQKAPHCESDVSASAWLAGKRIQCWIYQLCIHHWPQKCCSAPWSNTQLMGRSEGGSFYISPRDFCLKYTTKFNTQRSPNCSSFHTPFTTSNYSLKLLLPGRHSHDRRHCLASELLWGKNTNFSGVKLEMEMGNLFLLMAIESVGKPAGPTCESGMLPAGEKSIFPLLFFF